MELLRTGPDSETIATLVLAHGAGAAMDSPWMDDMAGRLAARGVATVRFEFGYMAARRAGRRRPPPRAETLVDEYRTVVTGLDATERPLLIGGKSMGGRVASLVADDLRTEGSVAGLVCLGYPFHPPTKPEQTRTAHLADLATPTLICQGERDQFGGPDDVAGYDLSPAIELRWFPDGDHDLRPRLRVSGHRFAEHLDTCADAVAAFARRLAA